MPLRRLSLVSVGIALGACSASTVAPAQDTDCANMVSPAIVLPSTATLSVGDTMRLTAILAAHCPGGPTTAQWRWESGNSALASVDSLTGLVTARAAGTTTVVATATFDSTIAGAATVRVLP
jgi:uncharacterized protein YjdB